MPAACLAGRAERGRQGGPWHGLFPVVKAPTLALYVRQIGYRPFQFMQWLHRARQPGQWAEGLLRRCRGCGLGSHRRRWAGSDTMRRVRLETGSHWACQSWRCVHPIDSIPALQHPAVSEATAALWHDLSAPSCNTDIWNRAAGPIPEPCLWYIVAEIFGLPLAGHGGPVLCLPLTYDAMQCHARSR